LSIRSFLDTELRKIVGVGMRFLSIRSFLDTQKERMVVPAERIWEILDA
jgi:hypothetical protein